MAFSDANSLFVNMTWENPISFYYKIKAIIVIIIIMIIILIIIVMIIIIII